MVRKLLREFFLLPRGEQRALLLIALLVLLTLGFRMGIARMPERSPPGLEQFREEALMIRALLADSRISAPSELSAPSGTFTRTKKFTGGKTTSYLPRVHLNTADSTDLLRLPGIGPVYAGRIVKYRRLLGGFIYAEQLGEVYGMRKETLDLISPCLVIDTLGLQKLPVNSSSFRTLLRHPYLEYEDVKALLNYMNIEGGIDSLGEIRHHSVLPDSVLDRIGPYLDFSP